MIKTTHIFFTNLSSGNFFVSTYNNGKNLKKNSNRYLHLRFITFRDQVGSGPVAGQKFWPAVTPLVEKLLLTGHIARYVFQCEYFAAQSADRCCLRVFRSSGVELGVLVSSVTSDRPPESIQLVLYVTNITSGRCHAGIMSDSHHSRGNICGDLNGDFVGRTRLRSAIDETKPQLISHHIPHYRPIASDSRVISHSDSHIRLALQPGRRWAVRSNRKVATTNVRGASLHV